MGQPRVIEVDYYVMIEKVKRASDARKLVERTDKEKWKEYITENGIRETSLVAHSKVKFPMGKPRLVAIVMDSDWDGCYSYSIEDESALKYIPGT